MVLFSPDEEERLAAIISSLPTLNENIADPARHEKLLSFLQSHADRGPAHAKHMVTSYDALTVTERCLVHPDYRVPSLALRFMGHLVSNEPMIFQQVWDNHPAILSYMLAELESDCKPQVRFACVQTLELCILTSELAAEWLYESRKLPSIILRSLLCPSLYVVTATCDLVLAVINHPGLAGDSAPTAYHSLAATLHVSAQLPNTLNSWMDAERSEAPAGGKFAAIQLLWALSSQPSERAEKFLRDGGLIFRWCTLLYDPDRIVRGRVLDILKAICGWAFDPMALLDPCSPHAHLQAKSLCAAAFKFFTSELQLSTCMDSPPAPLDMSTAIDALQVLVILAKRSGDPQLVAWLVDVLTMACNALWTGDWDSFDSDMEAIRERCDVPAAIFMEDDPDVQSDNKLCRTALGTMSALIKQASSEQSNEQHNVFSDTAAALTMCLASGFPSAQSIQAMLDLLASLICEAKNDLNPHFQTVDPTPALATALRTLLIDSRWDVRESTISLLTRFLRQPAHTSAVSFLFFPANQDLIHSVLERATTDQQPYVRATAISCLRAMVLNPRMRVAANGADLAARCVGRIVGAARADAEGFVRRAGGEALAAVVTADARGGGAAGRSVVDRELMVKVFGDEDVEVRVGGVKLLAALLVMDIGDVENDDDDDGCAPSRPWLFATVGGTDLMVAASEDYSRLVRQEAHAALRDVILPRLERSSGVAGTSSKRDRIAGSMLETVAERLQRIDMDRLRVSAVPEHVYQEVLDVDESILREGREAGAGNNRLACYDC
ncbi:hypothetical protein HDU87_008567 [Geranomyces variabilis]|uniref:Uncharacterized protein n=1 Tax=Geranomyces variabilis TaxID=109894 RepID=A0AAD5XTC7_9FUNG|nr:hypothetical protein HDU87_008567 [Geranomyces variabilis]